MIIQLRSIVGWGAITAYLVTGAVVYFRVMPGANWHWPPDFHFLGYDVQSIAPFLDALSGPARDGYVRVLEVYDRAFIIALAAWLAFTGWRGSGLRYFVAGLAVLYAMIDLSENAAILRVLREGDVFVSAAHHLTMAKFASLYLCILVLIVHVRRTV